MTPSVSHKGSPLVPAYPSLATPMSPQTLVPGLSALGVQPGQQMVQANPLLLNGAPIVAALPTGGVAPVLSLQTASLPSSPAGPVLAGIPSGHGVVIPHSTSVPRPQPQPAPAQANPGVPAIYPTLPSGMQPLLLFLLSMFA